MNDAHKAFLQSFMTKGAQKGKEVKELYKKCCEEFSEPQYFEGQPQERNQHIVEFIRIVNASIQPFSLEIKKGVCEEDGTHYYCMVNSVDNGITRLAVDYTALELEFFKKLIETIVAENDGFIGSRAAVNIVEKLERKMGRQDAECLLERLQLESWIMQKDGKISLSIRSILELSQYLNEVYNDFIKTCNICKSICLKGQSCDVCGVKIHRHCASRYFSGKDNPQCPDEDCRSPWPHAVSDSASTSQPSQSQSASSDVTRRKLRRVEVDA